MPRDNITINGLPLRQYLSDMKDREVAQTRLSDAHRKLGHPLRRNIRNVSHARTGEGHVIWTKGQKATHVLVGGSFYPWLDKAPFVTSGMSVLGAAEFCDTTEEFKCHECGSWVKSIGQHLRWAHRNLSEHAPLTVREYKIRHGFSVKTGFTTDKQRDKLRLNIERSPSRFMRGESQVKKYNIRPHQDMQDIIVQRANMGTMSGVLLSPETANLLGKCKAQCEEHIKGLYRNLGRTPTIRELRSFTTPDGHHPLNEGRLRRLFGAPVSSILARLRIPAREQLGKHVKT